MALLHLRKNGLFASVNVAKTSKALEVVPTRGDAMGQYSMLTSVEEWSECSLPCGFGTVLSRRSP